MIVYYGGVFPDTLRTIDPPVILGYDAIGNVVSSIRYHNLRAHDFSALDDYSPECMTLHVQNPWVSGWDVDGAAVTGYQVFYWGDGVGQFYRSVPLTLRANAAGWVFCASSPTFVFVLNSGVAQADFDAKIGEVLAGAPYASYGDWYYSAAWQAAMAMVDYNNPVQIYPDYFRVFRRDGSRVPFPDLHGAPILDFQLDASGNIIVGGHSAADGKFLRKYDSSGALLWSSASGYAGYWERYRVKSLTLDAAGDVYAVCHQALNVSTFRKYASADGALLWSIQINTALPFGWFANSALDDDGDLYTCTEEPLTSFIDTGAVTAYFDAPHNAYNVQKWDSDGNLIGFANALEPDTAQVVDWLRGTPRTSFHIHFYGATLYATPGNYSNYAFPDFAPSWYPILKLSNALVAGTPIMVPYFSGWGAYLAFGQMIGGDSNGNIFLGYKARFGVDLGSSTWAAYDSADTQFWDTVDQLTLFPPPEQFSFYFVQTITADAIAVVEDTELPPLAIGSGLGIPSWEGDRYALIPALALALALRAPTWLRDYLGPTRQTIYRLYLTGTPWLELALESFTVRRVVGSQSLSVVSPLPSLAGFTAIEARVDEELVLMRGIKLADGTEQLDEMLRVALDGIRADLGASSASATLDGAMVTEANDASRTLRGISYRAMQDGQRRVRCEVDIYLTPGSVAVVTEGESFTVGEVVCTVSASAATMEVVEAVAE